MSAATSPQHARRRARPAPAAVDFLRGGGWHVASIKGGGRAGAGLTAHRGVLHPGEYVDRARLVALVEERLGFAIVELRSVYSTGGRIPDSQRGLRARVDARLLELSRAGANLSLLGRVVGVVYDPTIRRALKRAKAAGGAS